MKRYISDCIENYIYENKKPWHMPGHKRKDEINPLYKRDFTEVPGLDDYHHATGVIKDSQDELAKVYGSFMSRYLVNGSTSGILTAVFAACRADRTEAGMADSAIPAVCADGAAAVAEDANSAVTDAEKTYGAAIIVASNCHKSVFNAIRLLGITPIYIEPDRIGGQAAEGISGPINICGLKTLIEENRDRYDIRACVITSPTYEGIMSDVKGAGEVLHEAGIVLIVDEAHGAHLPFCSFLPESALYRGADIVVQSLHKTLPSLTQTAILHMSHMEWDEGGIKRKIIGKNINKYLSVFQSSSPSYIFLREMEGCVAWCDENRDIEFERYKDRIEIFRKRAAELENIRLLDFSDYTAGCGSSQGRIIYDKTRLVFSFRDLYIRDKQSMAGAKHIAAEIEREAAGLESVAGAEHIAAGAEHIAAGLKPVTGQRAAEILEKEYGMVMEMAGKDYVVAISTVCDDISDFNELYFALSSLDRRFVRKTDAEGFRIQDVEYTKEDILERVCIITPEGEVPLKEAAGKISEGDIYVYPPGIPIVREGGQITDGQVEEIASCIASGRQVHGIRILSDNA